MKILSRAYKEDPRLECFTGSHELPVESALKTVIVTFILLFTVLAVSGSSLSQTGEGWQFDTFGENLNLYLEPVTPTTDEPIVITIQSTIPEVHIEQANLYVTVYPKSSAQFFVALPFIRINETFQHCTIQPFPLNGYNISFYVMAYDWYYTPMASGNYVISLEGSGWKHEAFADNLELEYHPKRANATEEVGVTLKSKYNVTVSGANLYITYLTPGGELKEGGWNFTKTDVNGTEFKRTIPGYPAGTNVTFWVTAWDLYGEIITSKMYNYSVLGVVEYTDFPFEYAGSDGNRSVWVPDLQILISMAVMCAMAIPLFMLLYSLSSRRERRKEELVKSEKGGGGTGAI
jgi:hypothetical protein